MNQDRAQIQQLKTELKVAEQHLGRKVRANESRLLKLVLAMVILAIVAGVIHGRIHIF